MTDQTRYWDSNLDPQNLSQTAEIDVDEEIDFLQSPEYRQALDWLGEFQDKWILDVGCGLGINAINLARRGANVVAIDISHQRLSALAALLKKEKLRGRVYLVQTSAHGLGFKPESFDNAYSKSVLIHTDLSAALANIQRTLKTGGSGAFIEPMKHNPFVNLYRRFFAPPIWREITRYFGKTETAEVLNRFPSADYRDFFLFGFFAFYFQYSARNTKWFHRTLNLLCAIDRAILALIPPLRRFCWMRVFRAPKESDRT